MFSLLAGLEFTYFVAPRSAQSLFMGFHFISRIITGHIPIIYRTFYQIDFDVSIVLRLCSCSVSHIAHIFSVRTVDPGEIALISTFLTASNWYLF